VAGKILRSGKRGNRVRTGKSEYLEYTGELGDEKEIHINTGGAYADI